MAEQLRREPVATKQESATEDSPLARTVDDFFSYLLKLKMDDEQWLVTYCVGEVRLGLTVPKLRLVLCICMM